jgi:TetR/AcrR family transcriptional regulator, transcriptional repressor of bet genes
MQPRQSFIREVADIRRLSLIAACARCLAARGAQGVSVRAICKEAGVSAGLLRHYFSGVDALIAETYRATGDRVERALADAVANAPPTPRARLLAYVTASFRAPIADADLLATWLAFWGLVKTDPAIAAIHDDIYRNYRTGIETLIDAQSATPRNNRLIAVALTALVDGLWLELSLGSAPFTPEEASVLAERWLDTLLT